MDETRTSHGVQTFILLDGKNTTRVKTGLCGIRRHNPQKPAFAANNTIGTGVPRAILAPSPGGRTCSFLAPTICPAANVNPTTSHQRSESAVQNLAQFSASPTSTNLTSLDKTFFFGWAPSTIGTNTSRLSTIRTFALSLPADTSDYCVSRHSWLHSYPADLLNPPSVHT